MDPFFIGIEPGVATRMGGLSRQMFDLREQRKRLLEQLDCEDAESLLMAIREGVVAEHPGYEAWLALGLLQEQHQACREQLDWHCRNSKAPADPLPAAAEADVDASLPPMFRGQAVEQHADGTAFRSQDGLHVLARVLSPGDWSIEWRRDTLLWRLDTAPVVHAGVTGPIHLHQPDGTVIGSEIGLHAASREDLLREVLLALADGRLPAAAE